MARATRVPLALVEFIDEHLNQEPPTEHPATEHPAAADRTADQAPGVPAGGASDGGAGTGTGRPSRTALLGRRFRWTARAVRVAFLLNAALAATAAVTHAHALADASLIAIPVILGVGLGLLWAAHFRTVTGLARIGYPDPRKP